MVDARYVWRFHELVTVHLSSRSGLCWRSSWCGCMIAYKVNTKLLSSQGAYHIEWYMYNNSHLKIIRLALYSILHILPVKATRGHRCSPLPYDSNLIPEFRVLWKLRYGRESGDNDLMTIAWMDKRDTWRTQKIDPMLKCLAKFLELRQTPLTKWGLLTTGYKLTIMVTRKVPTSKLDSLARRIA